MKRTTFDPSLSREYGAISRHRLGLPFLYHPAIHTHMTQNCLILCVITSCTKQSSSWLSVAAKHRKLWAPADCVDMGSCPRPGGQVAGPISYLSRVLFLLAAPVIEQAPMQTHSSRSVGPKTAPYSHPSPCSPQHQCFMLMWSIVLLCFHQECDIKGLWRAESSMEMQPNDQAPHL